MKPSWKTVKLLLMLPMKESLTTKLYLLNVLSILPTPKLSELKEKLTLLLLNKILLMNLLDGPLKLLFMKN